MKIGVLGTGTVGQTLAGRLAELGHDVVIGTRDPDATLARTDPDPMGNPPFATWHAAHGDVRLATFSEAGAQAELLINATAGGVSLAALEAAGGDNLSGKVLLDVGNALDFSNGFPPSMSVVNTDSLAEQLQRAFPELRVVKSLNTMTAAVMVDPQRLAGDHDVFVAGDDAEAKQTVVDLLTEIGWPASSIIDLGGLTAARGCEMFLPLWLSLMQTLGTPDFNIKVVKA
jgi:predicted dinucleotide-binding enzyme